MIVIETCPKCGADLFDYVITTFPPISAKECLRCGWRWEDITNDITRIPFIPRENIRKDEFLNF